MRIKFTGPKFFDPTSQSFQSQLIVENGKVLDFQDAKYDEQIVLPGGFAFPAFRDGHCHPLFAGREADGPDVSNCKSIDEIQGVLAAYRLQHQDSVWIAGGAYDRNLAELGRFMAEWIDEVIPDIPVVIHAADHHTIWVNSKALELLPNPLPKLSAGSVDVDEIGRPTGVLREPEAMAMVLDKAPARTLEQEVEALCAADGKLASQGIVFAQDAWITPGMTEVYLEAERLGKIWLDYNLAFKIEPESWQAGLEFAIDQRKTVEENSTQITATTVKFFADGVFGSATASMLEPYQDPDGYLGEPLWREEELKKACLDAQRLGFQLHIHAIGDAGVRQALDAIEFVQNQIGHPKVPNVIAHAELIDEEDIPRFATLGVVANMQPLWAKQDGMLLSCLPRIGQDRLDSLYKMRDLISCGATIAFGSDWPVSSSDPLLGIATAISRSTGESESGWTLDQALTPAESIACYSQNVSFQITGLNQSPLQPGSAADFIILDTNLLEATAPQISCAKVLSTYKYGRDIFL